MPRQLQRRELRRVQDLVRIRIADSAEQPGIRQRPFQGVVLHPQPRRERRRTARERVDASGIEIVQAVEAAHERQRRAPPGARLRQDQRAGRELERRKSLARDARPLRRPAEPPRDHQVKHREDVIVECPDDPFANPIQAGDGLPFDRAERRIDRSEQERRVESDPIQPPADDARGERVDVEKDVRQFWHGVAFRPRSVPGRPRPGSGLACRSSARHAGSYSSSRPCRRSQARASSYSGYAAATSRQNRRE